MPGCVVMISFTLDIPLSQPPIVFIIVCLCSQEHGALRTGIADQAAAVPATTGRGSVRHACAPLSAASYRGEAFTTASTKSAPVKLVLFAARWRTDREKIREFVICLSIYRMFS